MQITLNVEGSQLDSEVKSLLASLTDEQKKEMAFNLLTKSLENSNSELMISVTRQRVADEFNKNRSENDHVWWCDQKKDWLKMGMSAPINVDWSTRGELNRIVSERSQAHAFFKQEVLTQMVDTAQKEIKELIKTSPVITEAIQSAKKMIEDNLPKMVHDAMLMYFCTQMETMSRSIATTMFQSGQQEKILNELQQRLS